MYTRRVFLYLIMGKAASALDIKFLTVSYSVVGMALLMLFVAGSIGILGVLFFAVLIVIAYFLEGTKHQISERIAIVLVFWQFHSFMRIGNTILVVYFTGRFRRRKSYSINFGSFNR